MSADTSPTAPAKSSARIAKNRLGNVDMYNIAKSIGRNTRVEPKSGCKKINKIGTKNTAPSFIQNFTLPLNFRDFVSAKRAAAMTQVPILAISEGCMDMNPRSIQRVAL